MYFVLQFLNPRERRGIWNLEGLSRFLESAQLPKSGARRGIWIVDPGWSERPSWKMPLANLRGGAAETRKLGNCFLLLSTSRQPEGGRCGNSETVFCSSRQPEGGRCGNSETVFCSSRQPLRGGAAETRKLGNCFLLKRMQVLPNLGIWAAPRPQLNGTVCPAPPGAFEPIPLHSFFFFFASCGNSESWKVETAITLPVVCTFPAREMPLQRLQGHRWAFCARRAQRFGQSARPARAAGGSASPRSTLASSPHRLMRGALKVALLFAAAVTCSAVMAVSTDLLAPLPHDWICAAPVKSAGTGAPSAVAGAVGALTGC